MKKLITILFFITFVVNFSFCQSKLKIGGTLIMAAVGSDGIMVAADSRAMSLKDNLPYFYFDGTTKLIELNNFIFGTVGTATLNAISIFTIVKNYNNTIKYNGDIRPFVIGFYRYLKSNYSEQTLSTLKGKDRFIIVGYFNNKPAIIVFSMQDIEKGSLPAYAGSFISASPAKANFSTKLKCYELGKRAEKAIKKFAKKYEFLYSVGGPISIVQVKPNGTFKWIQNKLDDKMEAMLDGTMKVELIFLTKDQRRKADSLQKVVSKFGNGSS